MEVYYRLLFTFCLLIMAVIILIYLIRSIRGPQLTDRILAINAIGMLTIGAAAILAAWQQELYLLDVCLIYAMLSFLGMVVLLMLIARLHFEEEDREKEKEKKGEGNHA